MTKVVVCIASRGRKKLLGETIAKLESGMVLPDTRIAVALDSDDAEVADMDLLPNGTVHVSIAEREDSLGLKFNRCAGLIPAETYVLWADDMVMPISGWDKKIADAAAQFEDGYGVIYFGNLPGVFQPGIAVTQKFIDGMGFFNPPYFPYWWADTWIDEVARLTDRILQIDVPIELLQPVGGASRGVREIPFWAEFFDRTRPMRRSAAEKIITQSAEPTWRRIQLRQRMPGLEKLLEQRNSKLRDPTQAAQLEAHYSFDAPADERYHKLKQAAVKMLEAM